MADEFNIPKKQIPYFINTLPLTYNASITYYEQVGQLVYKINELIDAMNSYAEDYKSYTDEQIALLKKYLAVCDLFSMNSSFSVKLLFSIE